RKLRLCGLVLIGDYQLARGQRVSSCSAALKRMIASSSSLLSSESARAGFDDSTRTKEPSSETSASRRLSGFALAASMAADAAALAAAWKVASWTNIRHAVRAVMKAITAAVIAILNVNIRFCPFAHGRSLPRARPRDRRKRESQPRAARPVFEL